MASTTWRAYLAAAILGSAAAWSSTAADEATLGPSKDNTLYEYESLVGDLSNGIGPSFFSGTTSGGRIRRAVLTFDIAGAIPAGSTITAVTLTLNMSRTQPGTEIVRLHRLLADWGEGTSNSLSGGGGMGAPATPGDATWRHRFYSGTRWTTAGGDYAGAASASQLVGGVGAYPWSSSQMVTDVQGWLDSPGTNFGWILVSNDEVANGTAKRFDSREHSIADRRPKLVVTYTVPSTTGACCLGSGCSVLAAADCTMQGGAYQGDGTSCTPDPCPQPTGACCLPHGTCSVLAEAECTNQGGAYQGDGSACDASTCRPVLEPFVDELPRIPVAQPSGTPGGTASYAMAIRQFTHRFHRDLPLTTVWGFDDGAGGAGVPGPTIETVREQPITVTWINDLRDETGDLRTDHYLHVDPCPHGAHSPTPRAVVHLHGGHSPAEFDGHPEDTLLPGQQETYHYPNQQLPATLWYHDHALGITRLNVYLGLAGFYLIRDADELALGLPAGEFEIPLMIQDRSFNLDGALFYPEDWDEHFLGDAIAVNGKVWPYLRVKQGLYRFRLLNGSNARSYSLGLSDPALRFVQIGTDGGLLPGPVTLDRIDLAPAERADVVLDFALAPANSEIVLTNEGGSPAQVMKFIVVDEPGHPGPLPAALRPLQRLGEADAVAERQFELCRAGSCSGAGSSSDVLGEHDDCKASAWLINGQRWDDPIAEFPELGTVEVWKYLNRSGMPHPMHPHLVQAQILDRQGFQVVGDAVVPTGTPIPPAPEEAGWKDTIVVPPFQIVRIIARFEDYTGLFAHHCHVLEHEDNEMMRQYRTVDCGNGELEPGEECDDGNTAAGDCCSATCRFEPVGSACVDGSFCTDGDQCDGSGRCLGGAPRTCSDGVSCTMDTCDEAADACLGVPADGACDDGLFCNGVESCHPALGCISGTAVACDDGNACTIDACDETLDACGQGFVVDCSSGLVLFSTATNQFGAGIGTLRHERLYATPNGVSSPSLVLAGSFLTDGLGLDAADVRPDGSIVFSTTQSGFLATPSGGIYLDRGCLYTRAPATGHVAALIDCGVWASRLGNVDAVDVLEDGSVVFSTDAVRFIAQSGGGITLRPQNAYRFDPSSGLIQLAFDGVGLGLADLDAIDFLADGRVVFSTLTDRFVKGVRVRGENLYVLRPDGSVALFFDGRSLGTRSLDAASVLLGTDVLP